MILTQKYVKELFDYNPDEGFLYNKDGTQPEFVRHNYFALEINGARYYSHRIIWLWLYGYFPQYIDHKDGNGFNNRQINLREATASQNIANANFGLARGVESHGAKFRVRIWVNGIRINLGSFTTFEEAQQASLTGSLKYFRDFAYASRHG